MERRSWENATSPLKDPNRAPDPSTLRRWFHELDSSRPASSFLRPLVQTAAQWLARGEQHAFGSLHLSWPTIYPCLRVFWPWDFPSPDHYLPKPLSLEEDQQLQQQLRLPDTLEVNALRLMRATGIRISKCINLPLDCLQQISEQQVALRVPLGKLHSERLVPVDEETQHVVARMVELGALPRAVGRWRRAPTSVPGDQAFLLPRYWQPGTWYRVLHDTLADMGRAAGCTGRVNPHRLRHSFATEMVRLGVSLPALMRMMGHRDIRMTLRYVEVVQLDLQREFHHARQSTASLYSIPQLPLPSSTAPTRVDLATIHQSIAATHHLLQLIQPQLEDKSRRKLHRLTQRLLNIDRVLDHLTPK